MKYTHVICVKDIGRFEKGLTYKIHSLKLGADGIRVKELQIELNKHETLLLYSYNYVHFLFVAFLPPSS